MDATVGHEGIRPGANIEGLIQCLSPNESFNLTSVLKKRVLASAWTSKAKQTLGTVAVKLVDCERYQEKLEEEYGKNDWRSMICAFKQSGGDTLVALGSPLYMVQQDAGVLLGVYKLG